jgi:hypothetical protein
MTFHVISFLLALMIAQTPADPSCACVAQGKRWAQGESICVNNKVLRCGMSGNVSAWIASEDSCPEQQSS